MRSIFAFAIVALIGCDYTSGEPIGAGFVSLYVDGGTPIHATDTFTLCVRAGMEVVAGVEDGGFDFSTARWTSSSPDVAAVVAPVPMRARVTALRVGEATIEFSGSGVRRPFKVRVTTCADAGVDAATRDASGEEADSITTD
jgi:hypothetical protein